MFKKIRILHIIKTLNFGGAEENLLNLIQQFDARRFEVHVAYSSGGELEDEFKKSGIQLLKFAQESYKLKNAASVLIIWRLVFYILRKKIDIVHTHTFNAHIWGSISAKLTGRKIVEHVHDSRYQNPEEFKRRGETSRQYKHIRCLRNISDRVVVLTKQNFDFVIQNKINKQENVREIQNGIPLDKIRQFTDSEKNGLRQELDIPVKARVVLTPTRFAPEKNTELILKIAPKVKAAVPECLFVVAGDGSLLYDFRRNVEDLDLGNIVKTPGFYPDVQELLSISDIFLLPSKLELHSIAILEAMSMKVPVIVSRDVGCNSEFIEDWQNGVLLNPFNDAGWAEASINLLNNEFLRKTIGEKGHQTCRERFDIRDAAIKLEELYVELAS